MAVEVDEKVFTGEQFHVDDSLGGDNLYLRLAIDGVSVYDIAAILPTVQARIDSGKKPAGVLSKSVKQIQQRIEQLESAVTDLFNCYARMTHAAPQKRVSVAYKARYAVLDSMPIKLLKEYAKELLPDEFAEYILTDTEERNALIERLCGILVDGRR